VTAICFGHDCKLDLPTAAMIQAQTEEQALERERRSALQVDVDALCRSRNTAHRTIDRYRNSSRRVVDAGLRSSDCTEENAKSADGRFETRSSRPTRTRMSFFGSGERGFRGSRLLLTQVDATPFPARAPDPPRALNKPLKQPPSLTP